MTQHDTIIPPAPESEPEIEIDAPDYSDGEPTEPFDREELFVATIPCAAPSEVE